MGKGMNPAIDSSPNSGFQAAQDEARIQNMLAQEELTPELRQSITGRFRELASLHALLRTLPKISCADRLNGRTRGPDTLVAELLRRDRGERLLYVPARATIGRTAAVIKAQAWAAMCRALGGASGSKTGVDLPDVQAEAAVLELLTEDVYLSVLDGPASEAVRRLAALRLVALWDLRPEPALDPQAQALIAVWNSRANNPPAFGTLLGSSELVGLSLGLEKAWFEFAAACFEDKEVLASLEEFLFGLSYEELQQARLAVARKGPLGKNDINLIFGAHRDFPEAATDDPRDLYRFYEFRRRRSRVRSAAGLPGPQATLEEYYLQWSLETSNAPA